MKRSILLFLVFTYILSIPLACRKANAPTIKEKEVEKEIIDQEVVMELKPGENNPRNSEGDFITLKNGKILFIYSHFTGTSDDDENSGYLASRVSSDDGRTWSKSDKVVIEQEGMQNVMSVTLLRLRNGSIAFFYLVKNSIADCRPYMRVSNDEGETWGERISCLPNNIGYYVLNNDRVIQLKSGRLLLPLSLHQSPEIPVWTGNGTMYVYYSDDNGITWKSSASVPNPNKTLFQEPGVVELNDGRILMIMRTNTRTIYKSYSADGGQTWTPGESTQIASPTSPSSIVRIPSSKDLLMVWNNNTATSSGLKERRNPLTIAISKDEGKTWEKIKNVEEDPNGYYCYAAVHFIGDYALFAYCTGTLATTKVNRLSLRWLYQ